LATLDGAWVANAAGVAGGCSTSFAAHRLPALSTRYSFNAAIERDRFDTGGDVRARREIEGFGDRLID
jgi:hypothetical protein